MLPHGLIKA